MGRERLQRVGELCAIEDIRGRFFDGLRSLRTARRSSVAECAETVAGKDSDQGVDENRTRPRRYVTRWEALLRYVDDGRLEIDNNVAERALRVVALGRKNYLFAGSDRGGERPAAMSLAEPIRL